MRDFIILTGIVLKQTPIGEYDRRICLLTKERGKISAFVKGSRKPGSRLSSAANPFSFGTFKLFEGKSSYNVLEVEIQNYFEKLRTDYLAAYYGMYFCEITDYYTRENNDERQMLKLLYQSLRALEAENINNSLVKCVFEIKSIVINGEFPGVNEEVLGKYNKIQDSTLYAIHFIVESGIEGIYTFSLTDEILAELELVSTHYRKKIMDREFKSLEIIKTLG